MCLPWFIFFSGNPWLPPEFQAMTAYQGAGDRLGEAEDHMSTHVDRCWSWKRLVRQHLDRLWLKSCEGSKPQVKIDFGTESESITMPCLGLSFFKGTQVNRVNYVMDESIFRVVLQSPEAAPFGIIMGGHPNVHGLVIVDASKSAPVRDWNEKHPHLTIETGQAVLEVNGTSEPNAMLEQFRGTKSVELLITTELSPKQQAVLRSSLEIQRRQGVVEGLLQPVEPVEPADREPCSICHDDESGGEEAKLPCGHRFHKACVEKWLIYGHPRCPLCNCAAMSPLSDWAILGQGVGCGLWWWHCGLQSMQCVVATLSLDLWSRCAQCALFPLWITVPRMCMCLLFCEFR